MIRTLLLATLLSCYAWAADRYVSPAGTDSGSGGIGAPWATIAYGIANMDAGDTLWLRGGTHTSEGTGNGVTMIKSGPSATQFTRIRGYTGETALWKPTSTAYLLAVGWTTDVRSNIWIGDFSIDGSSRLTSANPFIGAVAFQNLVVTNLTMTTNSGLAFVASKPNGTHAGGSGLTVVSNTMTGWGMWRLTDVDQHALYVKAESGLVVRGNRMYNNFASVRDGSRAIHMYDSSTTPNYRSTNAIVEGNYAEVNDGAAVFGMQTGTVVRNNIFKSLGTSPQRACVDIGYGSPVSQRFYNNTFYGGLQGVRIRSSEVTPAFVNNIIWGSVGDPVYIESYSPSYWTNNIARSSVAGPASSAAVLSGNLFGSPYDPQFTSAPTDLTFAEDSPARNTGFDLSSLFTVDYYETVRPQEVVFDIGAYEWTAAGQLPTVRVTASGSASENGLVPATFTFTRAESNSGNLTVSYTITGTATPALHYVAFSDSVVIPDGQWSASSTVTPLAVAGYTGNKTVIVTIDSDLDYTIVTPSTATIEIVEGDYPTSHLGSKQDEPGKTFRSGRRR